MRAFRARLYESDPSWVVKLCVRLALIILDFTVIICIVWAYTTGSNYYGNELTYSENSEFGLGNNFFRDVYALIPVLAI